MKRLAAATISLFFFASFAYCDEVFLKSGKVVKGNIIEETDKFLRLDVGSGIQLRYYFDEIKNIQRDKVISKTKPFELKSAPLIPAQQRQETEQKVPERAANKPATKAQDLKDIETVVNNYLTLASRRLPADSNSRKQVFEQLAATEDLESMSSYLLFRQTIEQARQQNPGFTPNQGAVPTIRERFLESQIMAFQARYLVGVDADSRRFQISDIQLSGNQDQAIATVKHKADFLRFKLHKINSKWSIYSTE